MADNAFLDKGVLLGYCFFIDTHYKKCVKYIHSGSIDYYTTPQIEGVFEAKRKEIIRSQRKGVLENIESVTTKYSGVLSQSDIEEIQDNINREENAAWRYLLDFYEGRGGRQVYQVTNDLRKKIRNIEKQANRRRGELNDIRKGWIRFKRHDQVQKDLQLLKEVDEEDFWVCIDAHDAADELPGKTEFATNNPSDFGRTDVKQLVLNETAIDNIRLVFVSKSYSP